MKKLYKILLLMSLCAVFSGCGKAEAAQKETKAANQVTAQSTEASKADTKHQSKILVAYFSRADNIQIDPKVDATSSASINVNGSSYKGNVAIIADYVKEATGGDTFSIVTTENYPTGYRDTTDAAKEEQKNSARPELSSHVENMEDYDIIFLGYPIWWGGLPMPVYTFLEEYDFRGKTIIPFASHEGSGLGNGPSEIAKICPDAQVLDGFAVRGSEVRSSKDAIKKWIDGLNLEQIYE